MNEFYDWLGPKKTKGIRLAVMDMRKPFRAATHASAPQAAILFDKFHVMRHLNDALDRVRKAEYARLSGKDRRYIKGQKCVLLSDKENLTADAKHSLKILLAANKRLTRPTRSRNPSANSGTTRAKPGRGASSTTVRPASNDND